MAYLADHEFPITDLTIVGIGPMLVERVINRISWRRVLTRAAASGAWIGVCIGALVAYLNHTPTTALLGAATGTTTSMIIAALRHHHRVRQPARQPPAHHPDRHFTSASHLVANHYELLSHPHTAHTARRALAERPDSSNT